MTEAIKVALIAGGCASVVPLIAQIISITKTIRIARISKRSIEEAKEVAKEAKEEAALAKAAALQTRLAILEDRKATEENSKRIEEVHESVKSVRVEIDGHMTELLRITGESEKAKGVIEGKEQEKNDQAKKENGNGSEVANKFSGGA